MTEAQGAGGVPPAPPQQHASGWQLLDRTIGNTRPVAEVLHDAATDNVVGFAAQQVFDWTREPYIGARNLMFEPWSSAARAETQAVVGKSWRGEFLMRPGLAEALEREARSVQLLSPRPDGAVPGLQSPGVARAAGYANTALSVYGALASSWNLLSVIDDALTTANTDTDAQVGWLSATRWDQLGGFVDSGANLFTSITSIAEGAGVISGVSGLAAAGQLVSVGLVAYAATDYYFKGIGWLAATMIDASTGQRSNPEDLDLRNMVVDRLSGPVADRSPQRGWHDTSAQQLAGTTTTPAASTASPAPDMTITPDEIAGEQGTPQPDMTISLDEALEAGQSPPAADMTISLDEALEAGQSPPAADMTIAAEEVAAEEGTAGPDMGLTSEAVTAGTDQADGAAPPHPTVEALFDEVLGLTGEQLVEGKDVGTTNSETGSTASSHGDADRPAEAGFDDWGAGQGDDREEGSPRITTHQQELAPGKGPAQHDKQSEEAAFDRQQALGSTEAIEHPHAQLEAADGDDDG